MPGIRFLHVELPPKDLYPSEKFIVHSLPNIPYYPRIMISVLFWLNNAIFPPEQVVHNICVHSVHGIYLDLLELMIITKLGELADIRKWHGLQSLLVLHILGSSCHTSYCILLNSSLLSYDQLTIAI